MKKHNLATLILITKKFRSILSGVFLMTNKKNNAIAEYVIFGKSVNEQFENKRVIKSNDVVIANALMSVAFYRIKDQ